RAWLRVGEDAVQVLEARQLPRGPREVQRFAKLMADPPLDETLLRGEGDALAHAGALAVHPALALPRLLDGASFHGGRDVHSPDEVDADLIVVCAGIGAGGLGAPPLEGRL